MKNFLSYIIILTAIICFSNCAKISHQGPGGGPKDTIGPVVIKERPTFDEKNVTAKKIEISFNEYVKIKDSKLFIVSPPLKSQPTLITRGKRVIVEYDSVLNPETTYIFDFGSSIVDLNEGNPLGDYSLRFSTGDNIDSLHFSGRALDAFSGDSLKDLKVLLYQNYTDSLPFTGLPDAIARVSNRGFFIVEALKNKPYKCVVLEDKNNNNKYDAGESVGFLSELINPISSIEDTMKLSHYEKDSVSSFKNLQHVRVFKENINKQYLSEYKRNNERLVSLCFAQHHPKIDSLVFFDADSIVIDPEQIITENSFLGDTIKYWFTHDSVPSQMRARIVYWRPDSTGIDAPMATNLRFADFKQAKKDKKEKRKDKEDDEEEKEKLKISVKTNSNLVTEQGLTLVFEAPLLNINLQGISLYEFNDEGTSQKKVPFSFTIDSTNICRYTFMAEKWNPDTKYEAEFLSGVFTDIYKIENDSVRQAIQTPNPDKFCILKFSFVNAKCNYIVQLIRDRQVVQTKQTQHNESVTFSFIEAESYSIRIIEDLNNNGRWDIGSLIEGRQPERVNLHTLPDGTKLLKLKTGWETEETIDMEKFFDNTQESKENNEEDLLIDENEAAPSIEETPTNNTEEETNPQEKQEEEKELPATL